MLSLAKIICVERGAAIYVRVDPLIIIGIEDKLNISPFLIIHERSKMLDQRPLGTNKIGCKGAKMSVGAEMIYPKQAYMIGPTTREKQLDF